ncbi:hypothetical protein B0H14DRAFT_3544499 [Mycena olivaceomarginata]|nr:hypothetical protein B0H14DRAFT_3544499 [Mycena olivaceomarginata]
MPATRRLQPRLSSSSFLAAGNNSCQLHTCSHRSSAACQAHSTPTWPLVRKDLGPLHPSTSTQQVPSVVALKPDWQTARQSSRCIAGPLPRCSGFTLMSFLLLYALPLAHRLRRAAVVSRPLPRRCGVCYSPTACWKAAVVSSSLHGDALHLPRLCRASDSPTAAAAFDPNTPAPLHNFGCALSINGDYRPRTYTHVERVWLPSRSRPSPINIPFASPPFLRFLALAASSHPVSPLVTDPLRNRVDSPIPAGVVRPRALPVQTRQAWSRNPPGAHKPSHPAFVLHPLPFSSKHPPRTARLWTPDLSHTTVRATRLAALHPAMLRAIVPESSFSLMDDTNVIAVLPMYDPDEDSLASFPASTDDSDLSTRET